MKILVVYYSLDGNTRFAAEYIAERLGADLLKLRPENEPPRNPLKYIIGGKSVVMGEKAYLNRFREDPTAYDCIVLCGPVWAGRVTPAIREFVLGHPFEGKKVGLVGCSASGDSEEMFEKLRSLISGNEVISTCSLRHPKKKQAEAMPQLDVFCDSIAALAASSSGESS